MKVVWTKRAVRNRFEQLQYIGEQNPTAAARLSLELENQIRLLASYPEMGRTGRTAKSRELVISRTPFVVIYRIHHDSIEIFRLLHGAQKWPRNKSSA